MTADELRTLRKYLGLSQKGLAQQLGYTRRSVGNWETGLREVPRPAEIILGYLSAERDVYLIAQAPKPKPGPNEPSGPIDYTKGY